MSTLEWMHSRCVECPRVNEDFKLNNIVMKLEIAQITFLRELRNPSMRKKNYGEFS